MNINNISAVWDVKYISESEHQIRGNEESMIQAKRIDQQNLTRCLQRYVVPGYGRKRKHFYLEYIQHGVANNSQGAYF
jgi:hypothetical protein